MWIATSAGRSASAVAPAEADILQPGVELTRSLAPGETHVFQLALDAGQLLEAVVEQQGVDVALAVADPDGAPTLEVDGTQDPMRPERVLWIGRAAGTHWLSVRAKPGRPGGHYTVLLAPPRRATPGDERRVAAQRDLEQVERWFANFKVRTPELLPDARRRLQSALDGFRAAEDRRGEARALLVSAELEVRLDRAHEALVTAQQALAIYRELQDRRAESAVLHRMGWAHFMLGDITRSRERFEEGLRLSREASNEWSEATFLIWLGRIDNNGGDSERAIEWHEQALAKSRTSGNRVIEGWALSELGTAYTRLGEYHKALSCYEQALAVFQQLGDTWREVMMGDNMAHVHVLLEENGRGRELLLRFLAHAAKENPGGSEEAHALGDLSSLSHRVGDDAEALALARRALEISRRIDDLEGQAYTLRAMAQSLQKLGHSEEALASLVESLGIWRQRDQRHAESDTLMEMAIVERDRGNLREALRHAEAAVTLTEQLRSAVRSPDLRGSFIAAQHDKYDVYVDLLMRLHERDPAAGHDAAALQGSERARARVLLDTLVAARADVRGRSRLDQAVPATLEEIRRELLDDDTVLLEFYLGGERSFLWAVTRSGLTSQNLPERAQIYAAARRVHGLMAVRQRRPSLAGARQADRQLEAESKALGRVLLGGIAGSLATDWKGKRLLVVTSGALAYLPFGALPSPVEGAARPLLRDHEIVFAPSASVLLAQRREQPPRSPTGTRVAVLADPVFDAADPRVHTRPGAPLNRAAPSVGLTRAMEGLGRDGFTRLPFSRLEATEIRKVAPPDSVLVATDFEAARSLVMGGALHDRRIIHFATHGLLDSEHPDLSGLVLSLVDEKGAPRDGFLRMHEIYDLRLAADLVVLSACQTALGREIRGEGLVGLTRGFLHAGARSVVASLWQVDDESTAELMKRFYRGMLKENRRPADALRAAQLEMSRDRRWSAPFYWAGFVLQGEWR